MSAMALPALKSAADCADFSQAVLPFLPQLYSLPTRVLAAGFDIDGLREIYLSTNPLITAFAFSLFLVPTFVLISEINRNYSQVDRMWSILPSIYNGHFALWCRLKGTSTTEVNTILIFTIIWSVRLTFNYWRKGGYSIGSEDYRWLVVRKRINHPALFFLLNVCFISFTQSVLLFLITAPTYIFVLISTLRDAPSFGIPDLVFSRFLLFLVLIEHFADQQQWKFQQAKKQYQKTARVPPEYKDMYTNDDLDRGFVVSGLWAWCRHPNFVAEQAIWVTLYIWSAYRVESYFNWSGVGAFCLVLLFQASTNLTESITASKYPDYKQYQARVGKFIPRFGVEP
ncbi:hypothetical protein McanMca71_000782 [Microsporum canis]|uniref:DUF1295 domain-containing protein n=1 Tax=Arthroderma otae (strain ATCC MYA-4605 / CBS 113480) TaxID=554155 RepID=C5FLE1_ARTOC|nr:DUF1295 domain-containing protein [Microsporum canis CBS 113480]EEQ30513.1 DUF1295 domain-containing protein [Microsporum canis CBS 113480]